MSLRNSTFRVFRCLPRSPRLVSFRVEERSLFSYQLYQYDFRCPTTSPRLVSFTVEERSAFTYPLYL